MDEMAEMPEQREDGGVEVDIAGLITEEQALKRAYSSAPTRPHPSAPDTSPGNAIAGPVAALSDRIRGAVRHV